MLSPEIEDRDEFEVVTGRSTKRPSTLNDIQGYSRKMTSLTIVCFLIKEPRPVDLGLQI
jgi:hypothetical protein